MYLKNWQLCLVNILMSRWYTDITDSPQVYDQYRNYCKRVFEVNLRQKLVEQTKLCDMLWQPKSCFKHNFPVKCMRTLIDNHFSEYPQVERRFHALVSSSVAGFCVVLFSDVRWLLSIVRTANMMLNFQDWNEIDRIFWSILKSWFRKAYWSIASKLGSTFRSYLFRFPFNSRGF